VPSSPTAQQDVAVGHDTPWRLSASDPLQEVCADQVAPPFVVAKIVPLVPTAQQEVAVGHDTPLRYAAEPELCADQVAPPFVVAKILPL
jgi:hypothetical protein